MKFSTALVLVSIVQAMPNFEVGKGTLRMGASSVRTEKGGLADVVRDTQFKLPAANQSYFFMDSNALFDQESSSQR